VSESSKGNPIHQLFGQTAIYGMGIVLPRLLNYLLLTPFYTRVFPREEYGIVTELYAYVVFLLVILTYGMETGFFRFSSKRQDSASIYTSVLTSVFTTSALFVIILFSFIGPISRALQYEDFPEYIRWLALIVSIDAFTAIPFARIRLQNQPRKYALIRIIEVVINIGLNWFFLYFCPRYSGEAGWVQWVYNEDIGVGYVFISNLSASLVKLLLLIPDILAGVRGRFDMDLLRKILRYSYPLLIAGLAGAVNEALDRALLKHLLPPESNPMAQLGVYGANIKIAVLMTLYVQMFRYAAEPFFFSRAEEKDAKRLYADVMRFFMIPGILIFIVVTFYMDYFILFIGEDFREGARIVPVILMANLMMGILFNLSVWYKLSDKTYVGAILITVGALITVAINVIFVPEFGYVASAWGHLVSYSVMVLVSYFWSLKTYRIPYRIGKLLLYLSIGLICYCLDRWVSNTESGIINYTRPLLILSVTAFFMLSERQSLKYYRKK